MLWREWWDRRCWPRRNGLRGKGSHPLGRGVGLESRKERGNEGIEDAVDSSLLVDVEVIEGGVDSLCISR